MKAAPSTLRAALGEAGFSVVEDELWRVTARNPRHADVWIRAVLVGDTWEIHAIHTSKPIPVPAASIHDLIYLLTATYGEASTQEQRR